MNTNELLPCPFCGGQAIPMHHCSTDVDDEHCLVMCMDCYGRTVGETISEAIESWNRRAESKAVAKAPVVHGRWIEKSDYMVCSVCSEEWNFCDNDCYRFDYCPHCGANMKEEAQR